MDFHNTSSDTIADAAREGVLPCSALFLYSDAKARKEWILEECRLAMEAQEYGRVSATDANKVIRAHVFTGAWCNSQRPYYRIYPDYAKVFAASKLNVPLKYLVLPYPAFVIRLAKGNELDCGDFLLSDVTVCEDNGELLFHWMRSVGDFDDIVDEAVKKQSLVRGRHDDG